MCCLLWLFLSGWHGSESSRTAGTGSLRNCNTFIGWATPCTGRGRDQLGYPMKRQMKWLNIQFLSVCWSQGSPLAPGQDCLVWVLVQVWASSIVSLLTRWLAVPAPNLSQGKNENQSEVLSSRQVQVTVNMMKTGSEACWSSPGLVQRILCQCIAGSQQCVCVSSMCQTLEVRNIQPNKMFLGKQVESQSKLGRQWKPAISNSMKIHSDHANRIFFLSSWTVLSFVQMSNFAV